MADDAQAALAAAAAQIADLRSKLDTANGQIVQLNNQMASQAAAHDSQMANVNGQLTTARRQIDDLNNKYNADTARLEAEVSTQTTRANQAEQSRDGMAAKFDAMYGPETDGITRGPQPYIVIQDRSSHPTLEAAQVRQIAIKYGTGDIVAARIHRDRERTNA